MEQIIINRNPLDDVFQRIISVDKFLGFETHSHSFVSLFMFDEKLNRA